MDDVTWSYIVFVLAATAWLCYALAMSFFIMSLAYARLKLHKKTDPGILLGDLPGVTVIKPLMGIDARLEENLESHFRMKYPKFELLMCVQDEDDPAIGLVQELRDRFPKVDCQLVIGGRDGIINPMVHNMAPAYEIAKYDYVWVSTSRIYASTDILMDMVGKLHGNSKCALVHQLPFTTDHIKGLAAAVEKVYFGATVSRYYLAFNLLGISCFTGMSYLIKKRELDELNGLGWFGRFLAEDFFIAKLLHEKGFRHRVAAIPAQQNVSSASIATYKDRMVRWLRLRLNMMPFTAGILEPLGESIPLGVYMSWSLYHFFGFNPYVCFVCHWTLWCIMDYWHLRGVQHGPLPFGTVTFVIAWVIRELLYLSVYFEAVVNVRRIKWGKRTYRLSNFGESLEVVSDKSLLSI